MTGARWLFSYGTLRDPAVQRAVFGRVLDGQDDALAGFRIGTIAIADPEVVRISGSDRHPALLPGRPEDRIAGSAYPVDDGDLDAADRYETAAYRRIDVVLASGRAAKVYVAAERAP